MSRQRRTFTAEFKLQMVKLYENGKSRADIAREYEITPSALDRWIKNHQGTGSFSAKDNRTEEENELIRLRKENQRLMMENDILKQAALIMGRKLDVIRNNAHKYSVSAMCDVLHIPRSSYYYQTRKCEDDGRQAEEADLQERVYLIFKQSRHNYGTRKIKKELEKQDKIVSRGRISSIMKQLGLVSNYTIAYFKPQKNRSNEAQVANILNREFQQEKELSVIVSDLTYVRVGKKWHYVCLFVDLFNREIVGSSAGPNKDAALVYKALSSIKGNLTNVQLFHTDRGSEFDNQLIAEATAAFGIQRSLSTKGCPYDNAVAEATYKSFKIEFVYQRTFLSLEQLELELRDYVHWFNNIRIHQTLGYLTPTEFKQQSL
ncbi:IS3 family transposase [Ureibacillus chungkukjangi]|uniref:IS3 family transposase n=1 Tax=Ureibacillus chungkukjangi TaxID=1202712 RepID=UPI000D345DF9|nr:IS3 family transposase [Ureibacillus chungkukjangi]MCM3390415.1 IS3 family transposase [Ureibacillus chungkukjangi]HCG4536088.1 IS3 family transposase [Salmonella enterica subsp. enterica serovar Typhi str. AG3]